MEFKNKDSFLRVQIKCELHLTAATFLPPFREEILPIPSIEEQFLNLPLSGEISSPSSNESSLISFEGHAIHVLNHFLWLSKKLSNYTFMVAQVATKEDLLKNFTVYGKVYRCSNVTDCSPDHVEHCFRNAYRFQTSKEKYNFEEMKNRWFESKEMESTLSVLCNSLCVEYFGN